MGCTRSKRPKKISTELTPKQITMLEANTEFSANEIREWHTDFLRECPNGNLDKKEFAEVYKRIYQQKKVDSFCKYAFATFDVNNDGTIDFEEFMLAVAPTSQAGIDNRLDVAFEIYEISGDGKINQEELAILISTMYDLAGEINREGEFDPKNRAAEIIAKLDTNGDGKLSKEEFIAGCKSNPDICRLVAPDV